MYKTIFTLRNGIEAVLEEEHSAPVVSINALIKVGSAWEERNEWGMSHLIEHMLFKGTKRRSVGAIAKEVEAAGGEINAYTTFDHTLYFINMASDFAQKGVDILADAIQNSTFDSDELAKETDVVIEEIRRSNDTPHHLVSDNLFKIAYKGHPYGHPIIGTEKHVRSFTRKDILRFIKKWYTPLNMAIVIVGDFNTKEMIKLLEKKFGDIKHERDRIFDIGRETLPNNAAVHIESSNIQSSYIAMGYRTSNITHDDTPALDILAHVLGGAESSRLEQIVKEKKQLVHQISASSYTPRYSGLMTISAILKDELMHRALSGIRDEINRLCNERISSSELERAKLNIRSTEIYSRETVGGEGSKIAYFLATSDDAEFEHHYLQRLGEVNAEEIRDACQRYLNPNNLALSILVPKNSKWHKSAFLFKRTMKEKRETPKIKSQSVKQFPKVLRLKNGITLITEEIHRLPIVSLCALGPGGLRFENDRNNGISSLTARIITKGTKKFDAAEIAQYSEKIAGSIDGISGRHSIGLRAEFLSSFTNEGFDIFSEILTHPSFDNDEVEKEKDTLVQELKDEEDSLHDKVFKNFVKTLFQKHPYGLPQSGSVQSVESLKRESLRSYYFNSIKKGELIIAAVGDITPYEIEELIETKLADLPSGKPHSPKIPHEPKLEGVRTIEEEVHGKEQAHIAIGFPGTSMYSKDRFALAVLNNILAGQGGMLFQEVRDKSGLAYAIFSGMVEGVEPGYIAIYVGTDPAKIEQTKEEIYKVLNKLLHKGVTKNEIERAKQYIVGTFSIDMQRYANIALRYASNELCNLKANNINEYPKKILDVKLKDVVRVAHKYITLDKHVISILKPKQ